MKKKVLFSILSMMFFIVTGLQAVLAESTAELEKRIEVLEKQAPASSDTLGEISDRLTLFGTIELDYAYADDSDLSDTDKQSSSNLDIGTIELGLLADLHEYVSAVLLLKGEDLDENDGDNIFWDMAFFTIQKQDFPVYFIGGKTYQPFGVFETLFISDPITCDLYEINATGATIGATFEPLGIDISGTVYKGETLTNRVSDAGYGSERDTSPGYANNNVISYVFNMSLSPAENLNLSVYFNSESGDGDRNTTAGVSAHYEIAGVLLDGEYIGAIDREKHFTDNQEYKESSWFLSLGYQILDPLLGAIRYESFDDGQSGEQDEHLDYRYSIGLTYTFFENNTFACNLLGEYRKSEYELSSGSNANSNLNEFFTRIAVEF